MVNQKPKFGNITITKLYIGQKKNIKLNYFKNYFNTLYCRDTICLGFESS